MAETPDNSPVTLLLSYSHKDELLLDELKKHLAIMRRQGVLSAWHDRNIDVGSEWEQEIKQHLESDDIILLLVSPDFLNSDYCWDVEMRRAIERHDAGEAVVIPVFLRFCDWHGAPFAKLQGLPADARFVANWPDRDEAFTTIAKGIRAAIGKLMAHRVSPMKGPVSLDVAMPSPTTPSQGAAQKTEERIGAVHAPQTQVPQTQKPMVVSETGDLVLLDGQVFMAEKVEEGESKRNGNFDTMRLWIVPRSAEEEAQLRSFKSNRNSSQRAVSFAYRNQAFTAHVESATSISANGTSTCFVFATLSSGWDSSNPTWALFS